MLRYVVQWNYKAAGRGPWVAGDIVTLSEAEAAAANADSPGVVVAELPRPAAATARAVEAAPVDRAMRAPGRKRSGGAA